MRLYHWPWVLLLLMTFFTLGCAAPQLTPVTITVQIASDGSTGAIRLPAGSTVQDAINQAGLTLDTADRVDPPLYTLLTTDGSITIVRVTEELVEEEVVIPFDKQVVKNESLPEGETRLIQPGINGLQILSIRKLFEDGVETASTTVETEIVSEAVPEILMVGSQTPFKQVEISGRLAYLSAGNAWVMEGTTGNRRPVVTTGDLDGQIFRLSPDREWLLFTRRSEEAGQINSLWAASIVGNDQVLVDLGVENVIHFAAWLPGFERQVIFSTVEPRDSAPGWQANNDLQKVQFSPNGWASQTEVLLEPSAGGIYGWWGTNFFLAPDGNSLAYARPDGVGVLNLEDGSNMALRSVKDFTALNTQSDWAWVPGVSWAPTGDILFTVNHVDDIGNQAAEDSPNFDLIAVILKNNEVITISENSGMFTYPEPSPINPRETGELAYQLAYLQAVFPSQSDTSRYRLVVMDRDGSNRKTLFPDEGEPGLSPQRVFWSPEVSGGASDFWIAFLYNSNLYLIDSGSDQLFQLTGDGLIDRLDWQ